LYAGLPTPLLPLHMISRVLDKIVPSRRVRCAQEQRELQYKLVQFHQMQKLHALRSVPCCANRLGRMTVEQLQSLFRDPQLDAAWREARRELDRLGLPESTGGVNPGDQRALFYLIRALQPGRVLEVGTHIGCSTVNIALALTQAVEANGARPTLTTVDVVDINDPSVQPWKRFGSQQSPREMIAELGCAEQVEFRVGSSLEFLREAREEFDFIFLDGDHAAPTVYQEVPLALARLRDGGFILLHDYFPQLEPLWPDGALQAGVRLAIQRLENEGARLQAIPLGELPWPTKQGTMVTSLALLSGREAN